MAGDLDVPRHVCRDTACLSATKVLAEPGAGGSVADGTPERGAVATRGSKTRGLEKP